MSSRQIGYVDFKLSGHQVLGNLNQRSRRQQLWCVVALTVCATAGVDRYRQPMYRAKSEFDRGTEGWTVSGSGFATGTVPRHRLPLNGSGGWLHFSDVCHGTSRVDIAFVVDTTASMQSSLDDVQDKVTQIVRELRDRTSDLRVGLVSFTDEDDHGANAIKPFDLSYDVDSRMKTMAAWKTLGGTDHPEDQYLGILAAIDFSWRDQPDVIHAIVVISDNPPKQRRRFDRARDSLPDDISINTIVVANESTPVDAPAKARLAAEELAALTAGHVYSVDNSGEVAEQILASVEHVVEQHDPWMWVCPKPLVNWARRSYGKTLSYQLRQHGSDDYFEAADVILVGNPTLVYRTHTCPTENWTQFSIPLYESGLWRNKTTKRVATRDQFVRTLETLKTIKIRGEYTAGADLGELDNVRIGPTQPRQFSLRPSALSTKRDIK